MTAESTGSPLQKTETSIVVQFRPGECTPASIIEMDCLVDFDTSGEITGIELLFLLEGVSGDELFEGFDFESFKRRLGARVTYDGRANASYVYMPGAVLGHHRGTEHAPCKLIVDGRGRLCTLEVDLRGIARHGR